jgi:hypothetical protein
MPFYRFVGCWRRPQPRPIALFDDMHAERYATALSASEGVPINIYRADRTHIGTIPNHADGVWSRQKLVLRRGVPTPIGVTSS